MSHDKDFSVTIVAKARNGLLWQAVKKCGSQSALATLLGLTPQDIGGLLNLNKVPKDFETPKWEAAEAKLVENFGLTWDMVIPVELRQKDFLDMPKTVELDRRVPLKQLAGGRQLLLPSACDEAAELEVHQMLDKRMHELLYSKLSHRERLIVQMRYGFEPYSRSHTLQEVADVLYVTRETIRRIEGQAVRRLQKPDSSGQLLPCVDL